MSYTLYLIHLAAIHFVKTRGLQGPFAGAKQDALVALALSLAAAFVIWVAYERPIYALRRYFPYRSRPSPPNAAATAPKLEGASIARR